MVLSILIRSPIELELKSLGTLLFDFWKVSNIKVAQDFKFLHEGDVRDFMLEFVLSVGRMDIPTIKNKKEAYKSGKPIENISNITNDELELVAEKYIEYSIKTLFPIRTSEDEDNDEIHGRNKNLWGKLENESNQEHLRRLVNASLESNKKFYKNIYRKYSRLSNKWLEPLASNSFALSQLNSRIEDISAMKIPPMQRSSIQNESVNPQLDDIGSYLSKLILLTESEIKQAKLLNEQNDILVSASTESTKQMKISIYFAVIAIAFSAGFSMWSIIEARAVNNKNELVLYQKDRELKSYRFHMTKDIDEIKKILNK